ncbi:MAG: FtsW/RodA/SpoVE family cell cycle protein [Candidatus Caldipriscus sp.]|jgi:cell division protein FtsW|nr:FtsW/RodA/SpoVE family cell cycle protein [Candidatus Caldipriscus sp.]
MRISGDCKGESPSLEFPNLRARVYLTILAFLWLIIAGLLLQWSVLMYKSVVYGISPFSFLVNNLLRLFLGVLAFFLGIMAFNRKLENFADFFLWGSIALLVITLIYGGTFGGAVRWVKFFGFSFQPSEFVKYALIVYMGKVFALEGKGKVYPVFWKLFGISSVTAVLIALQPNISTATVWLFSVMIILITFGAKLLQVLTVLTFSALFLVSSYRFFPHVKERLEIFLGKREVGQVIQAKVAVISGGVFGKGPGNGLQKLGFLPSSDKDFAYSYISEEYGILGFPAGGLWIILMVFIISWNGIWASQRLWNKDKFKSFVCFGFSIIYFLFSLAHILVNLGLLPPTGLPLPFVSYGGSSFVANSFALGYIFKGIMES